MIEIRIDNFKDLVPDYEPQTTFWSDFSIADAFGKKAIEDTFKRSFDEWKGDCIYLAELALVLNYKIWQWAEKNEEIGRLYDKLWRETCNYADTNLKEDNLQYFYNVNH